jgi:hypothetical protein
MPIPGRRLLPLLILLATACSGPPRQQSHWALYPRPVDETRSIVRQTLAELGYRVEDSGDTRLEGRYTEDDRSLLVTVEIRPAGAECEVQVTVTGRCLDSEVHRIRNALERFVGRMDAALRR